MNSSGKGAVPLVTVLGLMVSLWAERIVLVKVLLAVALVLGPVVGPMLAELLAEVILVLVLLADAAVPRTLVVLKVH